MYSTLFSLLGKTGCNYNIMNTVNVFNLLIFTLEHLKEESIEIYFTNIKLFLGMSIYNDFKSKHTNKRIMYITTKDSYDLFRSSWLMAPDLAEGEIMVRLDDDDILVEDCGLLA